MVWLRSRDERNRGVGSHLSNREQLKIRGNFRALKMTLSTWPSKNLTQSLILSEGDGPGLREAAQRALSGTQPTGALISSNLFPQGTELWPLLPPWKGALLQADDCIELSKV